MVAVALCASVGFGATVSPAAADPAFPPSFPADQNQLPELPSEPQIYDALPIPTPEHDPWYDDPANLAELNPGDIIRSREVQTRLLGLPVPVHTKQLLFRSTNAHGEPIATATTVVIPGIPWLGSSRPVVSFQEAIDSTDQSCNPSHTLQVGTFKEIALMQYWIEQGFAFNIPDFGGKYNAFNTYDEGYMVLDSLRAMKNDTALGLTNSGIALYGFSGGASGAFRAAELRATYAPDVRILGAAGGGTPGDLNALADYATAPQPGLAGISSFTMWLGFASFSRQYPAEFDPERFLTPEGQAILADVQHRCIYTQVATGMYRPISEYLKPGVSFKDAADTRKVLSDNSLGKHIPDIPILWFSGAWDELIWQSKTVMPVVNQYWDQGADLRYMTLPSAEHVTNQLVSWLPSVAWISAILRGLPPGPKFKLDYPAPLPEGFPGT
ncbi:triacylglycerol lipase [Nocardia otitidiscaviarum]|uniref:lipase family protein n=1 Tax=Nocardia otitidiscaviarum TaxID=1823 RepID=UPI0004A77F0B|nr:lipase family protein [Nocardia otitidiscaviarum]MBF6135025.1 triacylglycerol lipase [Nocardia otitidiscaviarum]MBF6486848.1 triacylglycerol lipase [Nocardia otitidiscaviarum]